MIISIDAVSKVRVAGRMGRTRRLLYARGIFLREVGAVESRDNDSPVGWRIQSKSFFPSFSALGGSDPTTTGS